MPTVTDISAEREFECCVVKFCLEGYDFALVFLYSNTCHCHIQPFLFKFVILTHELCQCLKTMIATLLLQNKSLKMTALCLRAADPLSILKASEIHLYKYRTVWGLNPPPLARAITPSQ